MKIKDIDRKDGYVLGTGLPVLLTRWWLKSRSYKFAKQTWPHMLKPGIEFYVPLWAWPFELLHRLIFGKSSLS